ncbi:aspartic peptidase domain-containing protein [Colletotrichum phormii]|uniref:Aspartic peptidase domain-containing protein n=1 Tax=Colletotrichum phormii TaxID=359342 RepID=A0AAJ0EBB1_9PEZI|nr:aspartic peptidase domain-containing protein [Colletotrichum phormii]KAK1633427.1 aspartic peptidase domain-containing protein [Colletotrichum phormii]
MRSTLVLAQLSLLLTSVHAFFPWEVSQHCPFEGGCSSSKRELKDQDALGSDALDAIKAINFPGFHVGPQITKESLTEESESERVAREVQRLSRKYARFQSAAIRERASKSKRQSLYRIVTAADTTLKTAAAVAQDGTDFSYFAQVKLGSKEKPLWMLIDTGAGTSWVMGSSCTSSACAKHGSYGPTDSDTYKATGETFAVAYGSGSVKGDKITDTVSFAGMKFDFQFGVANETSDDFNHFPFDGILGLSMAGGETDNFMQVVKSSGQLPANIFCVYLNRAADGPNTSEISFGTCNTDKYTGNITYTGVGNDNGDWAIPLDGIQYDGLKSGAAGKLAYVDTGTSYVFGPQTDVAAFHKNIPGSTSDDGTTYKVPCDSNKDVTYTFSGVSYVISPKDWRSSPAADGTCTSNIYGHEVVAGAWLLGDVFLKNVYAVFDKDQKRIGFATRVDPPPVTSTATASATPAVVNNPGQTTAVSATPTTGPALGLGGHETSTGSAAAQTSATAQSGAASYTSFTHVSVAAAASFCLFAMLGFF